jgi:hypothetical protein
MNAISAASAGWSPSGMATARGPVSTKVMNQRTQVLNLATFSSGHSTSTFLVAAFTTELNWFGKIQKSFPPKLRFGV